MTIYLHQVQRVFLAVLRFTFTHHLLCFHKHVPSLCSSPVPWPSSGKSSDPQTPISPLCPFTLQLCSFVFVFFLCFAGIRPGKRGRKVIDWSIVAEEEEKHGQVRGVLRFGGENSGPVPLPLPADSAHVLQASRHCLRRRRTRPDA